MSVNKVIDKNANYLRFRKTLKSLDNSYVKVGYPEGKNPYPGGASVAEIAIYNEFGTERNGKEAIPSRPFFSNAFDKNREELNNLIKDLYYKILAFQLNVSRGLDLIGLFMVGKIQKEIVDLREPPNKESTKKHKKGVDNPLIDTGHMKNSTTYEKVVK